MANGGIFPEYTPSWMGGPPSGFPGWGVSSPDAWGMMPPGILPEEKRQVGIPAYFTAPPAGFPKLSPMAIAYLSQLFPMRGAGELPIREYETVAEQPEIKGEKGEVLQEMIPAETAATVAVEPRMPSAQLWGGLQKAGALPSLEQYVKFTSGGAPTAWQSFVDRMQGHWPAAQTRRPTSWAIPTQR